MTLEEAASKIEVKKDEKKLKTKAFLLFGTINHYLD